MLQLHPLDDGDLGVEAAAATPRRGGGLTVREMEKDDEVVFFSDDIDEVKAYAVPYGQSYFSDEMVSLVEDGEKLTIEEVRPSASWGGDSEAVGAVVINGWSFLPGLFMRAGGELAEGAAGPMLPGQQAVAMLHGKAKSSWKKRQSSTKVAIKHAITLDGPPRLLAFATAAAGGPEVEHL